ncbi:MAG: exodeoxyribonuclease V subunit alpha [Wenzhouxiangellaceae bacterium]|nr:exodeoxyribonuclease V subunit alpha [Wenzhouxiangellaceae bacterium]
MDRFPAPSPNKSARPCVESLSGGADEDAAPPDDPDREPDWQQIACALAVRAALTIVTGGPGTGKTWTVVRVLALLQLLHPDQAERPLRVRLAAPTGKAAQRLGESIAAGWQELVESLPDVDLAMPEAASTLHRLLGSQRHTRHFRHDRSNPLPADVVIVDEASMIDQELMHSLLEALAPATRLILLGDKDQLASVEAGAVFGELCRGAEQVNYSAALNDWLERVLGDRPGADGAGGLADRRVLLRRNRRSTPAINTLAVAVNRGDADAAVDLLRRDGDELDWPTIDATNPNALQAILRAGYRDYLQAIGQKRPSEDTPTAEAIDRWAAHCLTAYARFQVLTAHRHGPWGVDGINGQVHRWLHAARNGKQPAIADGEWFHGRPVMITRNDYATGLMNGDIGLCLAVPDNGDTVLRVVFAGADQHLRYFSPSRLRDCETAWAMTVHKAQGSEFTHAVLVLPDRPSPVLTRELIYTGLTRARERFTLIAPSEGVFRQAVRARTRRSSALADRIEDSP